MPRRHPIGSTETGSNGMVMVQPGHTEMRVDVRPGTRRDAILYAVSRPDHMAVNELLVRPTRQP